MKVFAERGNMPFRMMSITVVMFLLIATSCSDSRNRKNSTKDNKYLAVIEHDSKSALLRIAFIFSKNSWISDCEENRSGSKKGGLTPDIPKEWNVIYNNRIIGHVGILSSLTKDDPLVRELSLYNQRNLYSIDSKQKIPIVGDLTHEYSGWIDWQKYKPLIATSDTEMLGSRWEYMQISDSERRKALELYRSIVGSSIQICSFEEEISDSLIDYNYSDRDIVIGPAFSIQNNLKIFSMQLDAKLNHCDGPPDETWSTYWFGIDSTGTVFKLGGGVKRMKEYERMVMVDMGDFDGDGLIDALFWRERYNEDGYVLYYHDLERAVECSWHYH